MFPNVHLKKIILYFLGFEVEELFLEYHAVSGVNWGWSIVYKTHALTPLRLLWPKNNF